MRSATLFLITVFAAAGQSQTSRTDEWLEQQRIKHRLQVESRRDLDMQIARQKHEDFLRRQFENKLQEFFFAANAFGAKYWENRGLVVSAKPSEQKKWMVESFDKMVKAYRALEKADPSFDRTLNQKKEEK